MPRPRLPAHVQDALDGDDLEGAIQAGLTDLAVFPYDGYTNDQFEELLLSAVERFGRDAVMDDLLTRDESAFTHGAMAVVWDMAADDVQARRCARAALKLDPHNVLALELADPDTARAAAKVAAPDRSISVTRIVIGLFVLLLILRLAAFALRAIGRTERNPQQWPERVEPKPEESTVFTKDGPRKIRRDPKTGEWHFVD